MGDRLVGEHDAKGLRMALIVARFNERVTEGLLRGAQDCLDRHGGTADGRQVLEVPGAWEIPIVAHQAAAGGRFDGIVALGALVRGETSHFDWIAEEVARGLGETSRRTGIPVGFGVLTTETMEQALARAGGEHGNKGWEAALAAIELVHLHRRMA